MLAHSNVMQDSHWVIVAAATHNTPRQEASDAATSTIRFQDVFAICCARRGTKAV